MIHRLIPLVLALVVGATPVARQVCLVFCSEHQAASASASHVYPASHHCTPSLSLGSSAGCAHGAESAAVSTAVAKVALDVSSIPPGVAGAVGLSAGVTAPISIYSLPPPPTSRSLRTPLRV